jgi:hypothetical protein
VQFVGGAREVPVADHGLEVAKLAKLDRSILF